MGISLQLTMSVTTRNTVTLHLVFISTQKTDPYSVTSSASYLIGITVHLVPFGGKNDTLDVQLTTPSSAPSKSR